MMPVPLFTSWLFLTTATGAEATTSPAAADDLANMLDQAVVSTASKNGEDALTAPATTWTVTRDDLERYGMNTIADALGFLALGTQVESSSDGDEVGVRGVLVSGDYGGHMLLLIDGHAINEQWDSSAYYDRLLGLPLDSIDHIEVVLGPGSVLYGSNAMLGVVNIITRDGTGRNGVRLIFDTDPFTATRSGISVDTSTTVAGLPFKLAGSAEYYHATGPELSMGPQEYGADSVTGEPRRFTDDPVGTGIWGGTINEGRLLRVPSAYLKASLADVTLALRGSMARIGNTYTQYGNFNDPDVWQRERWLSADLSYDLTLTKAIDVAARLYADGYEYLQHLPTRAAQNCLGDQLDGCTYRLLGQARSGGLELRARADWFGTNSLTTLLGIDNRLRRVNAHEHYRDFATHETITTSDYTRTEKAVGAYLEQTVEPVTGLHVNLGARLDWDERFGQHLSPRAALALELWERGVAKLIYSEAFRAPNAYERYYADPTWWVAPDNLQPEIVRSGELAFEQSVGTERVVLGAFYSRFTDLVQESSLSTDELAAAIAEQTLVEGVEYAGQYRNVAKLDSYGVNAAWEGAAFARLLRYGVSVTCAKSAMENEEGVVTPLAVAAPYFGNAHVSYRVAETWPVLALAARVAGPRRVDASDFDPYPKTGHQVMLRASVSGTLPTLLEGALGYRLIGQYNTSTKSAYAVGPLSEPSGTYTEQETIPLDRYRITIGLTYDFNRP